MSLRLDLLLETIAELDECEANGEVISESTATKAARALNKDVNKASKRSSKSTVEKEFVAGTLSPEAAKKFFDENISKLDAYIEEAKKIDDNTALDRLINKTNIGLGILFGVFAIPGIVVNIATRDKDHSKQMVIRKLIMLKQKLISTYNQQYKANVVKVEKAD